MASSKSQQFFHTSGATDSVWVHQDPVSNRPSFSKLNQDIETEVCVIGAGIGGISTAYELVTRGREVVLLEARQVLSGETGRTSGHLTNDLDDGYTEIAKKHGDEGARAAAESHAWGRDRVGEISKLLGIECEYRKLPAYEVSQYSTKEAKEHEDEMNDLRKEEAAQRKFGIDARFDESLTVRGWDGAIDQRGGLIVKDQATFHPTKYLNGILKWLKTQPNFRCFDETRVMSVEEKGIEILGIGNKSVNVSTADGYTVKCSNAVEATCVPLQKLSVIAQMEFMRSYCIAARVPKGAIEDCDGLTHGVLAGRLIADEIDGIKNPWADVYSPKRIVSMLKSLPSMISHDVQINAQYKRFLQSDITDIEDLGRGMGEAGSKPIAVYKDEEGNVKQYSALCPHMKGVVCWNTTEKSFDCPVHGSRFSREGICVMGPSKGNLDPVDEAGKADQENVAGS
ncbi:hypothetical protein H9Q69_005749 [Fusarium xylarioides]|nr:hypothetical protein H9Q69_005749 [Fusarium xylarioides]KAG5811496.1 hypothetical protein H9Q71_004840 [Fusarium xylarioides]KAG5824883.1 hypothetical protein H9Q74_005017 [Fusarium xylarioides]